jgi:methionine synthase reductase
MHAGMQGCRDAGMLARRFWLTLAILPAQGNAEAVAGQIRDKIAAGGNACSLVNMKDYESVDVSLERIVVGVVSTTGQGDPPDSAAKFFRHIKKRANASDMLSKWKFGVLALGDTNYDQFCKPGKVLDKRLEELGAQRLVTGPQNVPGEYGGVCGAADDAEGGLEVTVEPWTAHLLEVMDKLEPSPPTPADPTGGHAAPPPEPAGGAPSSAADVKEESVIVQDVTGAWTEASSGDGALKAKYGVLPRRVKVGVVLEDCEPSKPRRRSSMLDPPPVREGLHSSRVTSWRYLTSEDSTDRVVVEMEFDIADAGWSYAPGDSVGVVCPNDDDLVDRMLACLGIDGSRWVKIVGESVPQHLERDGTVRDIVAECLDLESIPKKALVRTLADYCSDEAQRDQLYLMSSIRGKDMFRDKVEREAANVVELLEAYPSCKPPIEALMAILPALSPRYYSIASSPFVQPSRVKIAFSLVNWTTVSGKRKRGLCTHWLLNLCKLIGPDTDIMDEDKPPCFVPLSHSPAKDFKLPEDPSTPIIMVGPGTGVAPFVGFIQHRVVISEELEEEKRSMKDRCEGMWRGMSLELDDECVEERCVGSMWLFFGCRDQHKDFLYKSELQRLHNSGAMSLSTAFSREGPEKVYVQTRMRENGARLVDLLLDEDAVFFVCGDGAAMAKDVRSTVSLDCVTIF